MEIILIKDIENLGKANDIVTVKNGYGRNYLIPQKLALLANEGNKHKVAQIVAQEKHREEKILKEFESIVAKIQEATIQVGAKVGTSGKIFGSVTNVQLAEAIKKATGEEVDRRKISIKADEVKQLGTYNAEVALHPKVKVDFEFEVVKD